MYYDSIAFLCFFLPILLVLEAFVKGTRGKNIFLLAAGLVFYASGSFHALILLLISAAVNWGLGLLAMRGKKAAVFLAVVLNIGLLAAYRYSGVWIPVFSAAGVSIPAAALAMPAGLSFFTFKGISYVADVSRRREAGSRSFFDVLFYLSFFPQIMSGPLERFEAFRQQLSVRDRSAVRTARGLRRFALGLAKKLILSGGLGTMGFGFPAALGAKMGNPERPVVCITGDGGFQMNMQEMATAIVQGTPITICLLNNYYLGMVRQMQELFYGKRYAATCLRRRTTCPLQCKGPNEACPPYVPDFLKWAESYGAHGIRVEKEEDIVPALEAAKANTDAPTLIEFMIATEDLVLPMVPGGSPMSKMILSSNKRS